jgi:hypothetical protein
MTFGNFWKNMFPFGQAPKEIIQAPVIPEPSGNPTQAFGSASVLRSEDKMEFATVHDWKMLKKRKRLRRIANKSRRINRMK